MSDISIDDFALKILQRAKARNCKSVESQKIDEIITKIQTPHKTPLPQKSQARILAEKNEKSPAAKSLVHDFLPSKSPKGDVKNFGSSPVKTPSKLILKNFGQKDESDHEIEDSDEENDQADVIQIVSPPPMPKTPEIAYHQSPKTPKSIKVSQETRKNLSQLSQYYYGGDRGPCPVSDLPHSPEEKPQEFEIEDQNIEEKPKSKFTVARKSRLNALAATINDWEEDLTHVTTTNSRFNIQPVSSPKGSSPYSRGSPAGTATGAKGTPNKSVIFTKNSGSPIISACHSPQNQKGSSKPLGAIISGKFEKNVDLVHENSTSTSTNGQLDDSVIDALEAQGYVRTLSYNKLTYDYSKPSPSQLPPSAPGSPLRSMPKSDGKTPEKGPRSISSSNLTPVNAKPSNHILKTPDFIPDQDQDQNLDNLPRSRRSVTEMTALFEGKHSTPIKMTEEKDPSEMTVAERARFFEKQAREETERAKNNNCKTPQSVRKVVQNQNIVRSPQKPIKSAMKSPSTPRLGLKSPSKVTINVPKYADLDSSESSFEIEMEQNAHNPRSPYYLNNSTQSQSFGGTIPIPPPYPFTSSVNVTPKTPDQNQNRSRRSRSRSIGRSPSVGFSDVNVNDKSFESPKRELSPKSKGHYPGVKDTKRIRVNDPKPGHLYPSLTDIESTENETEAENNPNPTSSSNYTGQMDSSSEDSHSFEYHTGHDVRSYSNISLATNQTNQTTVRQEIENLIDEALDENTIISVDTRTKVSNKSGTPLVHTVSQYRLQCREEKSSFYNKVKWPLFEAFQDKTPSPDYKKIEEKRYEEKLSKLEDEVKVHQNSIEQASKALNLCQSTTEFSNSSESIELERVLLISTQKRIALLTELHRLKNQDHLDDTKKGGYLTLSEISVELKRDFIDIWLKKDSIFHFICVVKHLDHIDSCPLVPVTYGCIAISGGILPFSSIFSIANIDPGNFKVTLEIYALQSVKEFLPHETKYHIFKSKKSKKSKNSKNAVAPFFAGSSATCASIRSSNFHLCGQMTIDNSNLSRSHWNLDKVVNTSPLQGSLCLRIKYGK